MRTLTIAFVTFVVSAQVTADDGWPYFVPANFIFANRAGDLFTGERVNAPVFDWTGNLLNGSEWRFELYGGRSPDDLAQAQDWGALGQRAVISLSHPGYFRDTRSQLVVDAIRNEYPAAWLQVRAWNVELGDSYEAVASLGIGGYGESRVFKACGGLYIATIGDIPRPLLGLESFSVRQIVPEPNAWVLMAMGGVGLWWAGRLPRRVRANTPEIQAFGNLARR